MFRGRLTEEALLLDQPEEHVLRMLRRWVEEMYPSIIEEKQIVESLEACSSLLMQVTAEQTTSQDPATWPYIRKIRLVPLLHIITCTLPKY